LRGGDAENGQEEDEATMHQAVLLEACVADRTESPSFLFEHMVRAAAQESGHADSSDMPTRIVRHSDFVMHHQTTTQSLLK
jgi:hypothetical protein